MTRPRLCLPAFVAALAVALVAPFAAPHAAHAQTGEDALRFAYRSPALGARMLALGGAAHGGVADAYALYSNPAGLGYFTSSAVSGGLTSLSATDDGLYNAPGFTQSVGHDVTDTGLDHLAYIAKAPTVRGSLVFGASFGRVNTFDRELRYQGENGANSITDYFLPLPGEFEVDVEMQNGQPVYFPTFFRPLSLIAFETFAIDLDVDAYEQGVAQPFFPAVTAGTVLQTGRVNEAGSVRELAFGGAFEAAPGIMVGLSGNVNVGGYSFLRSFQETDFNDDNDGGGGTVDFDALEYVERLDADLVGIHLRGGFAAAVTRDLRLGVTIETPTYLSVNESYGTRLTTEFDNGDLFVYGDDASEDALAGEFEYELLTPWRLGAGLVFERGDAMLLADAEFVDWSQLEFRSDVDELYFDEQNQRIRDTFDPVVNLRLGVEYGVGPAALRVGAAFQPDPRTDDPLLVGTAADVERDRTFLSAGLGFRASDTFRIDFGWQQERYDDRYLPYDEVDGAPVVDESVVRNRFVLGLTVGF